MNMFAKRREFLSIASWLSNKGISRAPTVAIAYLIKFEAMGFDHAFDHVKRKSDKIDPNIGFLIQLQDLKPRAVSPTFN